MGRKFRTRLETAVHSVHCRPKFKGTTEGACSTRIANLVIRDGTSINTVAPPGCIIGGVLCFGMLVAALGCSDHGPEDLMARSQPADRFGLIIVSHSPGPVPGGVAEDLRVGAFFVRHAGFDKTQVLDLINLPDVPEPSMFDLAIGHCEVTERELGEGFEASVDSYVDLLDAGDVRLFLDARGTTPLRRRAFPDLFSNVGGVTYEASAMESATRGSLRIQGKGSRQVGDFVVSLTPTPIPMLRTVAGEPITSNYSGIDWQQPLSIEWSPVQVPTVNTQTYIELAALQFDRIISLRCRAEDRGRATLPQAGIEAVGRVAGKATTVRLSVSRVRHQRFAAAGLHDGDAFYVSRDSILLN
jgi:hypothetical protein